MLRTVEQHQRIVAGLITARTPVKVGLVEAAGLVLAADVVAGLSLPVFNNSAMDGYAVRATDVAEAGPENPVRLPVVEDIPAGRIDRLTLDPGTAHRIMTGAALPKGATAVVPVELTDGGTDYVTIHASAKPGQHIRSAGEDVTAGTTVLKAGQVVSAAALGLVAALGIGELQVVPRQRVLVMSTGSELVSAGTELKPGQIYESNAIMLAAAVREAGGEVVGMPTSSDDVKQFSSILEGYAGRADLIITSGGVSAGAYEVVKDAFGASSRVEFAKVAMQPGMPQGAGVIVGAGPATSGSSGDCPIVTLPGNPVSALVSFEVFVRPALRSAMRLPRTDRPRRTATLTESLTSPRGKRQFRRGIYNPENGTVTSYGPPASHHLRWLASANCLLEIEEDVTELAAGDCVLLWDLT
jgi:molybdopterin molybdotransferase